MENIVWKCEGTLIILTSAVEGRE